MSSNNDQKTVWVVRETVDSDSGSSPIDSASYHATKNHAFIQAFASIGSWIDGNFDDYNDDDIQQLRELIATEKFDEAIEHWNTKMTSSLFMNITEETIAHAAPSDSDVASEALAYIFGESNGN